MRLFLILIGTFITSTVCLFAAEAGMPQLDPTYWASQAFWLILIFTLLVPQAEIERSKIKDGIDIIDD